MPRNQEKAERSMAKSEKSKKSSGRPRLGNKKPRSNKRDRTKRVLAPRVIVPFGAKDASGHKQHAPLHDFEFDKTGGGGTHIASGRHFGAGELEAVREHREETLNAIAGAMRPAVVCDIPRKVIQARG